MPEDQFTLKLSPAIEGGRSRMAVSGALPTALSARELRRLLAMLAYWSGQKVLVVLSVGAGAAGWCECWTDALLDSRPEDFEVRFEVLTAENVGPR